MLNAVTWKGMSWNMRARASAKAASPRTGLSAFSTSWKRCAELATMSAASMNCPRSSRMVPSLQ